MTTTRHDHPYADNASRDVMDGDGRIDASSLTVDELMAALRRQASGSYSAEASVELLVAHGCWLTRPELLAHIHVGRSWTNDGLLASVDWDLLDVASLSASNSERHMLAVAAELAASDTGIPLGDLLCGLDETNTLRVLTAVAHTQPAFHRGVPPVPFHP